MNINNQIAPMNIKIPVIRVISPNMGLGMFGLIVWNAMALANANIVMAQVRIGMGMSILIVLFATAIQIAKYVMGHADIMKSKHTKLDSKIHYLLSILYKSILI